MLENGFTSKVAFSRNPSCAVWEKTVQPVGWDQGEPIDISTMFNSRKRTKAPRALTDTTPQVMTVAYNPAFYTQLREMIGVPQSITHHFPDGTKYSYWGWIKDFIPAPLSDGVFPEATMTVIESDWDPTNNVEAEPVVTSVAGT